MRNLVPIIYYGNLFYGLCAIVLALETNLQHQLAPNGAHFYFLIFAITVLYYSRIYYKSGMGPGGNQRTRWYAQYRHYIKPALLAILLLVLADAVLVITRYAGTARHLQPGQWFTLAIFPVVALLYTYKKFPFFKNRQLRSIGWLKPFFIGFAWSGLVTVYPVYFRQMQLGTPANHFTNPSLLFWLQNFLYVSALAVVFDVKDFLQDVRYRLRTYPTLLGINRTLLVVVAPMALVSWLLLMGFLNSRHAAPQQMALQSFPYLILLALIPFVKKGGILFYLVVIDGLMLLKGICGIVSTIVP